jgi:outer membrane protein OmpA-like peptidoglycan-associated protein
MKRLYIFIGAAALAAVLMTAATNVNAQENDNRDENGNIIRGPYETNRFGDNWFIGAGGGINIFMNEGYDIKIAPSLDINFGKWFTPSVGMRIGYQGLNSQVWADNASTLGPTLDKGKGQYLQKFGYMYIHGDFLWNMSNALSGYKETRFWNLVPYLHAGFYRSYGTDGISYSDNELAAGAGLLHNLRLIERLDLIIDMRATVVNGRVHEATGVAIIPSVTMGLAVDLGWPGFVRTASIVGALEAANAEKSAILETAIVALEAANTALEKENINLFKANAEMKKKMESLTNLNTTEITNWYKEMQPMTVYFEIGKAVLGEKEMMHLDFYAKNIISEAADDAGIYITVMGSADSNTGTQARNKHLSEARGKYIFDLLTGKYGISPDRLTIKSEVVKAKANPDLSRSVIISL